MGQAVLHIGPLAESPLDAAQAYYGQPLARARDLVAGNDAVALVFEPAGRQHHGWRLAAVQELAREAAPCRVNALAGNDEDAIGEGLAYLAEAAGVTGQLLAVGGNPDELG